MKNKKGFTLIELLVVIAIIGLLSTLAVVSLNSARAKSRDVKKLADVRTLQSALELYASQEADGKYPIPGSWAALQTALDTYISTLPIPPRAADEYVYMYDVTGNNYVLIGGSLEDTTNSALNGDIDGNTTLTTGVCANGAGTACANKSAAQSCADPIYCIKN